MSAQRLVRFHRSGLDQPVAEYAEYECGRAVHRDRNFGVYECIRRSRHGYAVRCVRCAVDQTTGIRTISKCTRNPGCPIRANLQVPIQVPAHREQTLADPNSSRGNDPNRTPDARSAPTKYLSVSRHEAHWLSFKAEFNTPVCLLWKVLQSSFSRFNACLLYSQRSQRAGSY